MKEYLLFYPLLIILNLLMNGNTYAITNNSLVSEFSLTLTPVEMPSNEAKYTLEGVFKNSISSAPVEGVSVIVTNLNNDRSTKRITDSRGQFSVILSDEAEYSVVGFKTRYFDFQQINVSTVGLPKLGKLEVEMAIKEIVIDKTYGIENIEFEINGHHIREKSYPALDAVYDMLKQNTGVRIEILNHTDARGNDTYNMLLSQKRADAIAAYLIRKGIDPGRIVAIGYGESRLLNDCTNGVKCSMKDHQANRRTEFRVVAI